MRKKRLQDNCCGAENQNAPDHDCVHARLRGRPVVLEPEARRDRIFDALDAVFTRDGIAGLTMAAIAAKAGMSKRTLYTLFDSRESLLIAYLDRCRSAFVHPLNARETKLPLQARLRRLLKPDHRTPGSGLPIAVLRLAVATADTRPLIARACLDRTSREDRALIRAELDRAVERGEIVLSDTEAAASLLLSMVHVPILELLLDTEQRPTAKVIRERFELGLSTFLKSI